VISISHVPRLSLTVTLGGGDSPDSAVNPTSHSRRHLVAASSM
jgi:hypothetical protein